MRIKDELVMAASAAMLAALVGCGSDTPAPTRTPAGPNPCRLVTTAELTSVLGSQVFDGKEQSGGVVGQRTCGYLSDDAAHTATVAYAPGGAAVFDQLKSRMAGSAQDLAGLGDRAVYDSGHLTVLAGDQVLIVFVDGMASPEATLAAAKSLATAALRRLA